MPVELVTRPHVPILRTGHYDLQSGPVDFTAEHLAAAVSAFENDPAVLAPRIRVETPDQGHLDGEGIAVEASGGAGGPALGWADALTVEGDTLYADLHVPAELEACLDWAFPARSIEGLFGYTTATGHRHDFMATGLLLLGTSWPGVTTLPDLHELEREFAETVAEDGDLAVSAGFARPASGIADDVREALDGAAVVARLGAEAQTPPELVAAGLAVTDLRMRWYGAEADGSLEGLPESYDYWSWYVTEIRADDDGTLYVVCVDESTGEQWRFDVAAIDGTDVTFAQPMRGALDWRPAPAAAAAAAPRRLPMALARWTSRGDSRRATASAVSITDQEDDRPMNDAQRRALATSLGLDPDATEADVHAEAERRAADATITTPPEGGSTGAEGSGEGASVPEGEPAGVAARTATISRERLAELERDAAAGAQARAEQITTARTAAVEAAIADGRITPAEAGLERGEDGQWSDGWRRDMDEAPEVTARALERLERGKYPGSSAARGVVPQEAGRNGDSLNRALRASGIGPRGDAPKITEVTHR